MKDTGNNGAKIKSLGKALRVLDCFVEKQPLGVTEISEKLGIYKSNAYDILSTLASAGYVTKDETSGKYYLGLAALRLGRASGRVYSFQTIASEHIRQISRKTGEICYLTIPQDFRVFYLDVAMPNDSNTLLANSLRNSTDPMNTTGSGKTMLAYMRPELTEEYLSRPMVRLTEYTITDPEEMRKELALIRTRGYAIDNMENSIGLRCVAVPLLNKTGELVGAISVSVPSARMTDEKILEFAQILSSHVREIQSYL